MSILLNQRPAGWRISRAVVANRKGHGCVLFYDGNSIRMEIEEAGLHELSDLGLDDAPEGVSIWEGEYVWQSGGFECPTDGECYPSGKFRKPTKAEWGYITCDESPFAPPNEITKAEWDLKDEGCPCDNHPALNCETCRGACSCHFVTPGETS